MSKSGIVLRAEAVQEQRIGTDEGSLGLTQLDCWYWATLTATM